MKTTVSSRSALAHTALFLLAFVPLASALDTSSTGFGQGAPDGLDDIWQSKYNAWGLVGSADADNDGCSNLIESIAGTDPFKAGDCLKVGNTIVSGSSVTFHFESEGGKKYRVLSNGLPTGSFSTVENLTNINGVTQVGGVTQYIPAADSPVGSPHYVRVTKAVGTMRFYKLEVSDVDTDSDGLSDWNETQLGTSTTLATSPSNAAGGQATDMDAFNALLSLTATATTPNGFERVDKSVTTPVTSAAVVTLSRPSAAAYALTVPVSLLPGAPLPTKSNLTIEGAGADSVALPTTVVIPANATSTTVNVMPVQDATDEVPEYGKVSFGAPGKPGPEATVCICDADPTNPANQQLYVAFLGHEAGKATTASGYATALVNGDNTGAAVSVVFNNLSSEQNTAYIRFGPNSDLAPALPTGQVSGFNYNIVYKPGFMENDQLFLTNLATGGIWCAITTANYSGGEIAGPFQKASGSVNFNPPQDEPATGSAAWATNNSDQIERDIWRFMGQATFGGTTALYNEIRAKVDTRVNALGGSPTAEQVTDAYLQGLSDWMDDQMNPSLTPSLNFKTLVMAADNEEFALRGNKPSTYNFDAQINNATYQLSYDAQGIPFVPSTSTANNNNFSNNYPQSGPNRRREWWTMVLQCRDQLRQRMALALSEILIISEADQTVLDRHYGCANYWDMLASGAFGKYRPLLEQVTYSPMMGIYLSHMANRARYNAATPPTELWVSPDENYAREIMQLFSIGLVLRHPDGSLMLDGAGLPVPTYDNNDITELARVMTGFSHGARHANGYYSSWSGTSLAYNNYSSTDMSDQIIFNYDQPSNFQNGNNVWFGRRDGHLFWPAPWIYPMQVIGRISDNVPGSATVAGTIVYHDFNLYEDPATSTGMNNPVSGQPVSKRLLAGKHGEYFIDQRTLPALGRGANDILCHTLSKLDLTEAHNALAGVAASATYPAPPAGPGPDVSFQTNPGHTNTPINISRWLIQRLVTSNPSSGYIYRVQQAYRSSNGHLGTVMKAILLDYEARSLQLADSSISHGKVKEPLVAFAQMLRAFRAFSGAPVTSLKDNAPPFGSGETPMSTTYPQGEFDKFSSQNLNPPALPNGWTQGPFRYRFGDLTGNIGQSPQRAPSVFNWFLPDFVVPGPMAQAGLFAPELQINTEASVVAKVNMFYNFTWSNLTGMTTQPGSDANVSDFTLSNGWATPAAQFSLDGGKTFVNSLTFDSSNWNTARTITVAAADTPRFASLDNSTLRFSVSGAGTGYDAIQVPPMNITITDDEMPNEGLVVEQTGFSTWVQEGGMTDTVNVRLSAPPPSGATVTVNLATGNAQASVSPSTLSFTSADWSTNKPATVSAVQDTTSEAFATANSTLNLSTTSATPAWNSLSVPAISVNVIDDNDGASSLGILVTESGGSTAVTETGATTVSPLSAGMDSIAISLTRQPSASVTVTVLPTYGQLGLNSTGTTFVTSSVTRTFTTTNWATPQTVAIRGNDDTSAENDWPENPMHYGSLVIFATGGGYDNVGAPTVVVPVSESAPSDTTNDNRILISHAGSDTTETRVSEDGSLTDTITVALRKSPAAGVKVYVTLGSGQLSCTPDVLEFTTANYTVPQNVTVRATDDHFAEGLQTAARLSAPDANAVQAFASATISGGIVNGTTITARGNGYTAAPLVTFSASPTGNTATGTAVLNARGQVASISIVSGGSGYTAAPTVTIAAPPNPLPLNPTALCTLSGGAVNSVTVTSGGGGFIRPPTVGFTGAPNGGTTATGYALLNSEGQVSSIVLSNPGAGYVATPTVTFGQAPPQAMATIVATATSENVADNNYNNYWAITHSSLNCTVLDNDLAALVVNQSAGSTLVNEAGATDTVGFSLSQQPQANVTVTLTPTNQLLVNNTTLPTTLTFTTANWSTEQVVTVAAVNDATVEGDQGSNIGVGITSTDGSFGGLKAKPVPVTIIDNDYLPLTLGHVNTWTIVAEAGAAGNSDASTVRLSDTFTVRLPRTPTANVTVTLVPDANVTVSPSVLTFTTTNSGTDQTVTVTAFDDATSEAANHEASIRFQISSADPSYSNNAMYPFPVQVIDNDSFGVAFVQSDLFTTPTETATDSYTVRLTKAPTADVILGLTSMTNADLRLSANLTLGSGATTINSANVTCATTVGMFPGMTISGTNIPTGATVTGITNATTFTISANATATGAGITFTAGAVTASTAALRFTTANWSTPQGVTVTALGDGGIEGRELVDVNHAILAGVGDLVNYPTSMVLPPVTTYITDNFRRNEGMNAFATGGSIAVNTATPGGGATWVNEGSGFMDAFDIYLTGRPINDVIVYLSPSIPTGQVAQIGSDKTTMVFTPANWNIPQTVQVMALDDTLIEPNHATQGLTFQALSSDPLYQFVSSTPTVNIVDNETPAVIITQSGGSTNTVEAGATDTYTVVLNKQPNGTVVITPTVTGDSTVNPTSLTFDASTWNTPQTVTVTAVNDATNERNEVANITHAINQALTTDTSGYELPVTNCAVTTGTTTVTTGLNLNVGAGMFIVGTGIPANATASTVTHNTATSITTITLSAAATATNTGLTLNAVLNGLQTVPNNITDNDDLVAISHTGFDTRVHEDGTLADTIGVTLRRAPTGGTTVTVTRSVPASQGYDITPASVTFTAADWNTVKTFSVTGVNNGNFTDRFHSANATFSAAASGGSPNDTGFNITAGNINQIPVNVVTLDTPQVVVSESNNSTNLNEGGATDTVSYILSHQPTSDVTVTITCDSQLEVAGLAVAGVLTYGPTATLTFNASNWNVYQAATFRAKDDVLTESTSLLVPHLGWVTHASVSGDAQYNGVTMATFPALIIDNEAPGAVLSHTGGSTLLVEGGATDSYAVVLTRAPSSDVTVNITPDADASVSPTTLTFSSGNWSTPQSVTVTAVQDTDVEGAHSATIAHSFTSTDPMYSGHPAPSHVASITDDDGNQLVVTQSGGTTVLTENASNTGWDTFTLALSAAPTGTVTINLIPPMYFIPPAPYSKQWGYFTSDLSGSNQQRDRIVLDYTEINNLYRTTFYAHLTGIHGPSIPNPPSDTDLQNAHWAASKAIVDKLDLWFNGGSLKARYATLREPNQPPPGNPNDAIHPRQVLIEAIYYHNGGANSPGTTRYLPAVVFDPKNPPAGTFHDEIRDRCRWAGYLMTTIMNGFVAH
jgi:uncharacterized protein (DUF1800 family)